MACMAFGCAQAATSVSRSAMRSRQARTTGINLANDLRRRQFVWGGFRFHDW
jgi:hypothetical protein